MRFKALLVAGIFFASTSIALGGNIPAAWIGWKAEKIVIRDATVQLPAQERKSLETELQMTVAIYTLLEGTAAQQHGRYEQPAATIHNLRYRFATALNRVQQGLAIDKAACVGIGASSADNRFKRFRCAVTSAELEIPSAVVTWEGDLITGVVEGEPRMLGPFEARLDVRVTGRSTIAARQVE